RPPIANGFARCASFASLSLLLQGSPRAHLHHTPSMLGHPRLHSYRLTQLEDEIGHIPCAMPLPQRPRACLSDTERIRRGQRAGDLIEQFVITHQCPHLVALQETDIEAFLAAQ